MKRTVDVTITNLERTPEGYWRCRVHGADGTYDVHRKRGSWLYDDPDRPGWMKDVNHDVAAMIQEKVRKIERAEHRAAEAAAAQAAEEAAAAEEETTASMM